MAHDTETRFRPALAPARRQRPATWHLTNEAGIPLCHAGQRRHATDAAEGIVWATHSRTKTARSCNMCARMVAVKEGHAFLTMQVAPSTLLRLNKIAMHRNVSRSFLVRGLIGAFLAKHAEEKP